MADPKCGVIHEHIIETAGHIWGVSVWDKKTSVGNEEEAGCSFKQNEGFTLLYILPGGLFF